MSEEGKVLEPGLARALVRSLTRGTTVSEAVSWIHVGHERWLAAQRELLDEIGEDGYSDTKFIRGTYGSGKSHFLAMVQDLARARGWVTAHVECKADGVQIDHVETLYPEVTKKLRPPRLPGSDETAGRGSGLRDLLQKWHAKVLASAGCRQDGLSRPFDEDSRVYDRLRYELDGASVPQSFEKALAAFVRASLARDHETSGNILGWLNGGNSVLSLPKHYLRAPTPATKVTLGERHELRPIGKGTASEALHGLLWLVVRSGHQGLVLCIDEIEELAKLSSRRRQDQALQALREHVDNAGGESGYRRLCLYLAATPEMFENQAYFPRYDALATRIAPLGSEINWRAPVVDLDATPLNQSELIEMAEKIRHVHGVAFGQAAARLVGDAILAEFVSKVVAVRIRVAKPRLLARLVVDELERARQGGVAYRPKALDEQTLLRAARAE